MPLPLMSLLLLISVVTVSACVFVAVLMLKNPPPPLSGLSAVLAVLCGFSATAVYCYGWLSVAMGGPFPELCEDVNSSGARLAGLKQEYWPLRNACIYSDGSTVEYVSMSVSLFVGILAGLAVMLVGAAVFLRRRARKLPEATSRDRKSVV